MRGLFEAFFLKVGCKNTGVPYIVSDGRKKLPLNVIDTNQETLWFIPLNITFGTSFI